MTPPRSRYSLLHLQMGQEVIYLVLSVTLVSSLVLLAFAAAQHGRMVRAETLSQAAQRENENLRREKESLQQELRIATDTIQRAGSESAALEGALRENARLARELETLKARIAAPDARAMAGEPVKQEKPPILILSEAKGFYFELGSAELTDEFRHKLSSEIVPVLLENGARYRVDVIEVVGHTDELPVARGASSLDDDLLPFLRGEVARSPRGSDNAGLGMARAAAVARILLSDERLRRYTILPLSAGQAIDVDGKLALGVKRSDERERRRIEIRMRRGD
jgi:flagellar motor protein MotB